MSEDLKHLLQQMDMRFHESTRRFEDKLDVQNEILLRNTITLEEHVKRTNLLENRVDSVEKSVVQLDLHVKKDEWFQSSVSRMGMFIAGFVTLICTILTAWISLKK